MAATDTFSNRDSKRDALAVTRPQKKWASWKPRKCCNAVKIKQEQDSDGNAIPFADRKGDTIWAVVGIAGIAKLGNELLDNDYGFSLRSIKHILKGTVRTGKGRNHFCVAPWKSR